MSHSLPRLQQLFILLLLILCASFPFCSLKHMGCKQCFIHKYFTRYSKFTSTLDGNVASETLHHRALDPNSASATSTLTVWTRKMAQLDSEKHCWPLPQTKLSDYGFTNHLLLLFSIPNKVPHFLFIYPCLLPDKCMYDIVWPR